jgi:hypothetical protein
LAKTRQEQTIPHTKIATGIQNSRIVYKNMHITVATFWLKGIVKPQKRKVKRDQYIGLAFLHNRHVFRYT